MRLLEKLPRMPVLQNFPAVSLENKGPMGRGGKCKTRGMGKVSTVGVENSPTVWFAKGQGFEDVDLVRG